VDGRSDLYSLGCTFYCLLTGEPPFVGGTSPEKIERHWNAAPVSVQTKRPDVPEPIAAIVHKLLAKNPKWRYQTGGELATELAIVLGKKGEWSAPARPAPKPRPKLELEPDDEPLTDSSPSDSFDGQDLDEPSASTVPTAMMSTRETPSPRKRPGKKKKRVLWPWIVLAVLFTFGLVAVVGLVVRYLIQHVGH